MITSDDFVKPCGCHSVGNCPHNRFAEYQALDHLVDLFAAEMKKKLRQEANNGRLGWDDPLCADGIEVSLHEHILKGPQGQEIDIANLAAMLWNFRT